MSIRRPSKASSSVTGPGSATFSPSSSRPAASADPPRATDSTPDPSGASRFPPIGSCGNGNGKQRALFLYYCNLMGIAEAHPPGAAVARSPNGASNAAQRGWAPIPLVGQSEHRGSHHPAPIMRGSVKPATPHEGSEGIDLITFEKVQRKDA